VTSPSLSSLGADFGLQPLIGKLAARLMQLPGVIGVRVKIAKLEIFDDCEVAIRMEAGQW
jgi:dihydroneopterin aldolase